MGKNNQGYVLVVMTNKDVYYIYPKSVGRLLDTMNEKGVYVGIDAKSGSAIHLNTAFVSSVVEELYND